MMSFPQEKTYTSDDYWNLPEGQRAELIKGRFYDIAPPSYIHQKILFALSRKIADYIDSNHGSCEVIPALFAVNLHANDKTYVEPDISVICDKKERTTVYRYEEDAAPMIIPFDQTISVGIYSNLQINISELL